ncbi:uncharacterized protein [Halyomorpha halys]|uniref:uncharacterized protein n=1 Tax=Halyomorpha halys TaxID=286706 RepID=UPI0006D50447|nr:uncharacterized protein LOC106683239 [Halyomorpha halys]
MKNMVRLWGKYIKEYSYGSITPKIYKRLYFLLFLITFSLICDVNAHGFKLQENFEPKRFFTGTWFETQRLNKALTNWGRCLKIDSALLSRKINFNTSAYIPFLFSRMSFKSSTSLDSHNKPQFLMDVAQSSWNISIISTDYDDYALAYSNFINMKPVFMKKPPKSSGVTIVFRRHKNNKRQVKGLVEAARKNGISYKKLYPQHC